MVEAGLIDSAVPIRKDTSPSDGHSVVCCSETFSSEHVFAISVIEITGYVACTCMQPLLRKLSCNLEGDQLP